MLTYRGIELEFVSGEVAMREVADGDGTPLYTEWTIDVSAEID